MAEQLPLSIKLPCIWFHWLKGFHLTRQSGHKFDLFLLRIPESSNTTSLFGNMKSITISLATLPSLSL